jgi:hypothetical protein
MALRESRLYVEAEPLEHLFAKTECRQRSILWVFCEIDDEIRQRPARERQ